MPNYGKIEIEQLIFSHAARMGVSVVAAGGRLYIRAGKGGIISRTEKQDGRLDSLCALVDVYNRFFERENRRFLAADVADTQAQLRAWTAYYQQQLQRTPLRAGVHLTALHQSPKKSAECS